MSGERVAASMARLAEEAPAAYLKAVLDGADVDRALAFAGFAESIFGPMDLDESGLRCMMETSPRVGAGKTAKRG